MNCQYLFWKIFLIKCKKSALFSFYEFFYLFLDILTTFGQQRIMSKARVCILLYWVSFVTSERAAEALSFALYGILERISNFISLTWAFCLARRGYVDKTWMKYAVFVTFCNRKAGLRSTKPEMLSLRFVYRASRRRVRRPGEKFIYF